MMSNLRIGNVPLENTPELINSVQQYGGYINSDSVEAFTTLLLDRLRPQNGCNIDELLNIKHILAKAVEMVEQKENSYLAPGRRRSHR